MLNSYSVRNGDDVLNVRADPDGIYVEMRHEWDGSYVDTNLDQSEVDGLIWFLQGWRHQQLTKEWASETPGSAQSPA